MKQLLLLALAAAALAGGGCRKTQPGPDVTARTPAGDTPIVAVATPDRAPDAAVADAPGTPDAPAASSASPTFTGSGDALAPAITAAGDGWLVAWEDDDGSTRRVLASTVAAAGRGTPPVILSAGPRARGVRLAAAGEGAVAVWLEQDPAPAVVARALKLDGTPAGEAVKLSAGGTPLGPPEIAALADGYVVGWAEGADVHAARLDAQGAVAAATAWPGGNLRPWRGRGPDDTPPARPERAAPSAFRPMLAVQADGPHAFWWGSCWFSDDQSGEALYQRRIAWPDEGGEPASAPETPVWAALDAFAAGADGKLLAVQSFHDPNGGPWVLAVRRTDAPEAGAPFTSEPAGPLEPSVVAAGDGFVAGWASPTFGTAFVAIAADGTTGPVTAVPSGAPAGEASVMLAGSGSAVRAAYIDRADGRAVVRVVDPARAAPPGAVRPPAPVELPFETQIPQTVVGVRLANGSAALVWEDYAVTTTHVATGWLDAAGGAAGAAVDLTPGEPRCEGPSVAATGDAAVAAWACCAEASICGAAEVRLAVLRPGAAPAVRAVTPRGGYSATALAGAADGVALVMVRGEYSSRRIVLRRAKQGTPEGLAEALAAAPDVERPAATPDDVGAPAAAWGPAGLAVAYHDRQAGERDVVRLFLVGADGAPHEGTALPDAHYGVWGPQRLAALPDGFALLGPGDGDAAGDTTVTFLSADLTTVRRRVVVGRASSPQAPALAFADGVLAAAWYDRGRDADWAAVVGADGARRAGPLRLDDAAQRASFGSPVPLPPGTAGWQAVWPDARRGGYGLCIAALPAP